MNQRRNATRPAQHDRHGRRRDAEPTRTKSTVETTGSATHEDSFSRLLRDGVQAKGLVLQPEPAPLSGLDYPTELDLKNQALRRFWELNRLPDKPSRILPSPMPRRYRSTSKRKPVLRRGVWDWDFFSERPTGELAGDPWVLELPMHAAVYHKVLEKLREEPYTLLVRNLNFLIVRGDAELTVLFNLQRMNADLVRKCKLLADHLRRLPELRVKAVHLFCDPSRSPYYLEGAQRAFKLKKLFGPEFLPVMVAGRKYFLHPAGFFQVNPSLLPRLIDEVLRAMKPQSTDRLLDLFCGCGLFTVPLAVHCSEALGVELSLESCAAAHQASVAAGLKQTRFQAGKIDPDRLAKLLPPTGEKPEIILLDPPRQGTAPGLIGMLAARKPRRVAHLFCGLETLPREVERWRKHGYMVAKVQAFDMFSGTDDLEVMVVLLPDKYGLLGRKPKPRFSQPAPSGAK